MNTCSVGCKYGSDQWLAQWRRSILERSLAALQTYQLQHEDNAFHTLMCLMTANPDMTTLYATGDVRLWVEVTLAVRDGAGNLVNRVFKVDSGTEITTFPNGPRSR